MATFDPPNAADVRNLVDGRLKALTEITGFKETVNIEWRGNQQAIPVISMPVDLLSYNPATHRVRAQRSLDPERDNNLDKDPFGPLAQAYLHHLLMGDPSDPAKTDPNFEALKEDLREHGQSEPGIITRAGVLVNGNTRRAALKELGQEHIRVGVLPLDAGLDDLQTIELSLQLRKDHKRDYSFMNFLLAIDERIVAGRPSTEIQRDFRIKNATFDRSRWILDFIRDAIARSTVVGLDGKETSMRLIDFETHQGKLEELYRAYTALRIKSPEAADALREQRLFAIALGKSKTDVRLIEADFASRYMKSLVPQNHGPQPPKVRIPGTSILAEGPSSNVEALKKLTTAVLQARAVELDPEAATPETLAQAAESLRRLDKLLDDGLNQAGKQGRVIKKRLAAADRISDANDDLELATAAVSDARTTNNFNPEDLDEAIAELRSNLIKLAQLATRGPSKPSDGVNWLRAVASLPNLNG